MSRLFLHGSSSSPAGLPLVELCITSYSDLVGYKPCMCGADVRDGRVPVYENGAEDNSCQHGWRGNCSSAAQDRPPLTFLGWPEMWYQEMRTLMWYRETWRLVADQNKSKSESIHSLLTCQRLPKFWKSLTDISDPQASGSIKWVDYLHWSSYRVMTSGQSKWFSLN